MAPAPPAPTAELLYWLAGTTRKLDRIVTELYKIHGPPTLHLANHVPPPATRSAGGPKEAPLEELNEELNEKPMESEVKPDGEPEEKKNERQTEKPSEPDPKAPAKHPRTRGARPGAEEPIQEPKEPEGKPDEESKEKQGELPVEKPNERAAAKPAPRAAEETDARAARKPSEQAPSQPRASWWIEPRVTQQYEEVSKKPLKPDVEKRIQAKMLWAAHLDERPRKELTPREFGERQDRMCAVNYVLGKILEEGRDVSHLEGYAEFVETVRRCQEADHSGCWLNPWGASSKFWEDKTCCTKRASM